MINILYILSSTNPQGGATKAFMSMITGLTRMHQVTPFVVLPSNQGIVDELSSMKITVLVSPIRMRIYPEHRTIKDLLTFLPKLLYWNWINYLTSLRIARFAKCHQIQLIHTNVSVIDVGYRAARRLGLPHVYHLREYGDLDFGMYYFPSKLFLRRQLLSPRSYSLCITHDIRRHHQQIDVDSSRVIYDAVRPQMEILPTTIRQPYFLFAGRIEPAKGLDLLLEAYTTYCQQTATPWPLHIAGQPTDVLYAQRMKQYVDQHHIQHMVHFLGQLPDLTQKMQEAAALVVPSRSEGFGLCMAEAMFNGCLVIGHDTGGTHEQFENGVATTGTEIGLRYHTTSELAQLLLNVSKKPFSHYDKMRQRAFITVNQHYSIEANAAQMIRFYTEILN